ncbi:MAG: hypothetical protein IIZ93_08805 [Acidaminococcaceae bacterium]|nr:hypothetical protein [Acidaminococcaceae bacterium]
MSAITGYIIAIAVLAICGGVISAMAEKLKAARQREKEAEEKLERQQKTIADLLRYADEISRISQDKGKVENAIQNAKTDEELVDIANAIVNANNNRLRK